MLNPGRDVPIHITKMGETTSLILPRNYNFFINFVPNDAQRFHIDRAEKYNATYQQPVDMIEREYNVPVRRTGVKIFLKLPRVIDSVSERMEVSDSLAKFYKPVSQLFIQVPLSRRGDAH